MAIPLLATCDIVGRDITGDALLTQRAIASYLVARQAHYHFTVKGNQPGLESEIALLFQTCGDMIYPVTFCYQYIYLINLQMLLLHHQ